MIDFYLCKSNHHTSFSLLNVANDIYDVVNVLSTISLKSLVNKGIRRISKFINTIM
jgi:hypothetical protein